MGRDRLNYICEEWGYDLWAAFTIKGESFSRNGLGVVVVESHPSFHFNRGCYRMDLGFIVREIRNGEGMIYVIGK